MPVFLRFSSSSPICTTLDTLRWVQHLGAHACVMVRWIVKIRAFPCHGCVTLSLRSHPIHRYCGQDMRFSARNEQRSIIMSIGQFGWSCIGHEDSVNGESRNSFQPVLIGDAGRGMEPLTRLSREEMQDRLERETTICVVVTSCSVSNTCLGTPWSAILSGQHWQIWDAELDTGLPF